MAGTPSVGETLTEPLLGRGRAATGQRRRAVAAMTVAIVVGAAVHVGVVALAAPQAGLALLLSASKDGPR
jgi:hypothetical protein